MIAYLDTSAAMKLLVEEPESSALADLVAAIVDAPADVLLASWLLHTELHCAAGRHPDVIDLEAVGVVLDALSLLDLTRGDLLTAGSLAGGLRSHDALHLAVALRAGAEAFVTYDQALATAAATAGLQVLSPTR